MLLVKVISPQNGVTYLPHASGLTWSSTYPGGFQSCSFTVSGRTQFAPYSRLTVTKGPVICFDGEIRDQAYAAGPQGKQTTITAYGFGVLLTDDVFGPKVYADTRTKSWKLYNPLTAPVPTADHVPEKYTAKQDAGRLRIAAKPSAIFQALDMETFYFELPRIGGVYTSDTIKQVDFDYTYRFPDGEWALVAWEWDGTQAQVRTIKSTTASSGLSAAATITGTVDKTGGSVALVGTLTTFLTDLAAGDVIGVTTTASTLAGTGARTSGSTTLTGTGTSFTTLSVGDLVDVGGEIRRVNVITSNTAITVDVAWATTATGQTIRRLFGLEQRRVVAVASDTALTVDQPWAITATGQTVDKMTQHYSYTPTLSGCRVIGFALRSLADQTVWPGFINDGADNSIVHALEYGGRWQAWLNDDRYPFWHHQGGMETTDTESVVETAKGGGSFFPTNTSRIGAAARIRWTGRKIEVYALKATFFGNLEYQVWNEGGTSLTGPTTVDLWKIGETSGGARKTAASTTVDSSDLSTLFLSELEVGDHIRINGPGGEEIRKITAITSNTNLTVDRAFNNSAYGKPIHVRRYQAKVIDYAPVAGFGTYIVTLRALGTTAHAGAIGAGTRINFDYAITGVAPMQPFEDDALSVEISNISVKTTLSTINAALVAQDVITQYSVAGIGLSPSSIRINEAGASLPAYNHLVYDDPVTGADALDDVCEIGSTADKPLAWAVWDKKQLTIEEWDTTGARFLYHVRAADAELGLMQTQQEDFATSAYPLYKDAEGEQQLGAIVTSDRVNVEYGGRTRRVSYQTSAGNSADAATMAATYLANHDRPASRTRVTVKGPLRDQGGALVPLDEVRAGRLLRISGIDEWGQQGVADVRGGLTGMITSLEYDADGHSLTLEIGDGPNSYERVMARLSRQQARDRQAG